MRSISFRGVVRAAAAAALRAAFATCAQAYDGGGGHGHGPSGPSGHAPSGADPLRPPGPDADAPNACGAGLTLAAPPADADAADALKALSRATQAYIAQCHCATQTCIADALDQYAAALAAIAPRLPPALRDAPNIVARAARRVRVARTTAQATQILDQAIADVTKRISYIRASDAETQGGEARGGAFVVDTLNAAALSLEKAGGL